MIANDSLAPIEWRRGLRVGRATPERLRGGENLAGRSYQRASGELGEHKW